MTTEILHRSNFIASCLGASYKLHECRWLVRGVEKSKENSRGRMMFIVHLEHTFRCAGLQENATQYLQSVGQLLQLSARNTCIGQQRHRTEADTIVPGHRSHHCVSVANSTIHSTATPEHFYTINLLLPATCSGHSFDHHQVRKM